MSITEAQRHLLYVRLEATLGEAEAQILMEHLPPVGWADVATKRDLDHLETVLRSDMATLSSDLRGEMSTLEGRLTTGMETLRADLMAAQRNQVFALVTAMTTLMGIALVVLRFS